MTNGHPDRAWNGHVCFDIFCFVPFRYIRFAKLHSLPVFVYISFCFVPFRFVSVNFVTFHFVSFRFACFVSRFISHFTGTLIRYTQNRNSGKPKKLSGINTRRETYESHKEVKSSITEVLRNIDSL